jgi:hypothetical protein
MYSNRAPVIAADGLPSRRTTPPWPAIRLPSSLPLALSAEGEAAEPRHRQQHRVRVVGQGDVEFGPGLRHAAAGQGQGAVHRALLGRHLFQADVGKAAEQAGRQRLAAGLDHGHPGRGQQAGTDRADDAALDQHVGMLQGAARSGGVHGGVADQQILRGDVGACEQQRGGDECPGRACLPRAHRTAPMLVVAGCPSMKSDFGCRAGSLRSYTRAPST